MIKIIIDGEEYTEKQYQKDLIRLFDSLREKDSEDRGELNCENDVSCCDCPLQDICLHSGFGYTYVSYDYIEAVYKWAKEHPIKTKKKTRMFKPQPIYKPGFDCIWFNSNCYKCLHCNYYWKET